MNKGSFSGRKSELEEKFFLERDRALLQALREKTALKQRREALSSASGITDGELLDQLDELEVSAETVAALTLIPLIVVAWADGNVDVKERRAVLDAAEQKGIDADHPAHQLLQQWLKRKPDAKLLAIWKEYIGSLSQSLDSAAKTALKTDLLGRARAVAETAGGLLGLGNKVSKSEQTALNDLEEAFG